VERHGGGGPPSYPSSPRPELKTYDTEDKKETRESVRELRCPDGRGGSQSCQSQKIWARTYQSGKKSKPNRPKYKPKSERSGAFSSPQQKASRKKTSLSYRYHHQEEGEN